MKRLFTLLLAVLLISVTAVSVSAQPLELAPVSTKTVVQIGDWMFEKIENDSRWELDEYVGDGGEILVPRIVGDLMVVQLGNHCFSNNTNAVSVITSSPLWTVGEYCFINCTSLENFECNYALSTIKTGAFSGTSSLKSINLQDSIVTEIAPDTFLNSGIEEIELPETCTALGAYSFGQCAELKKIVIPTSVTSIHPDAFKSSDNLTIYCYTDSYAQEYAEAQGIPYVLLDAPVTFILGDADGDNHVTIVDATVIQRVLVELRPDPDGMIALRGSSDGDKLNVMHATKIQRWLAQFKISEPIGEVVTRTRV